MSFYNSELTSYLKMDSSDEKEAKRKDLVLEIREELVEKRKNLSLKELEAKILTKHHSESLQSVIQYLENYKDRISRCEHALARIEVNRISS